MAQTSFLYLSFLSSSQGQCGNTILEGLKLTACLALLSCACILTINGFILLHSSVCAAVQANLQITAIYKMGAWEWQVAYVMPSRIFQPAPNLTVFIF